jgi:ankyrin repeat protein
MRQLGDALLETGKEPPARASDRIKDKDKKSLIDQLYFANIDERLTTLTAAQGTTCRWFITKSEYVSWYDMAQGPDYCGFLWIKGNPGTGKSTLMKFLFEEARLNTKGDPSQITLSFFFLARGTVEEKSTIGLYRSLLHQIFEKAIDLKDSLEWMTPDGAKVIQRNGWNEEALKQTLTHAIRMLGTRSLTIFVDALDECDKKQVADMVCFFEELCDGARETQAQLRICFSSRHYPTIVIQKGIELVLEHEIGHSEDIKHYIKSKLRLGNSAQAELLRTEILEKSSRIFLWVVLVLDILNSEYPNSSFSIKKIREHLKKIPPKLTDLFEMILMRDGENLEQLQLCLKWILFATRPLTPQELYVAIQLGLDKECSSYWDPEDVGSDQMKTFVRSSSKGLAEVTPTTSEVQFIHESIRDFLLGKYGGQWSGSDNFVGHSHEVLKNCCMAQLNASIPQNMDILRSLSQASKALRLRLQGGNFNEETLKLRKRFSLESPFLKYAVCNVLHHANSAQQNAIEQRDFLANFPRQWWTIFDNTFRDSWTALDFYEESTSLLYILAADNLADLIRVHPQRVSCFDVENNETYGPPIFAALATESHEAVQAFLEIQAGIQPQDPLLYALYKDYCAKRNKCTNNSRTFAFQRYKNIFSYLIELGNEIVLAFLCASAKFNVESKDTFDRTPLLWAAESGEEAVVKILLKRGAELEAEDEYGQTPLSRAAESGHEEVVRLLLEKGANPQARDKVNWTPLSYAAKNGHRAVTKLLVERGANLEDENSYGWTPLLRAAEGGYEAVVKLLLEQGANLEAENCYGWTALSLAAANGHGAVAKLLLEKGVHPEARSSYGQTPLSLAAENGHQAVVQLLLKKGADQEAKDNHGQTPLSWATKNGHEEVVMLLRISAGKPHESGFYYSRDKR